MPRTQGRAADASVYAWPTEYGQPFRDAAGRVTILRVRPGWPTAHIRWGHMKKPRKHIIIVSLDLSPDGKQQLDAVCDQRGMTIKSLLGRLIAWFSELDKTQQSVLLGQVEGADRKLLADLLAKRK